MNNNKVHPYFYMSKKGFIYKYTYPNGKVYIGQTRTSVDQRHKEHIYNSRRKSGHRQICDIAIAKYGEPILETIETIEVDDKQPTKLVKLLNEAEKKWIKEYDSTNFTKGYNVQLGGEIMTPEEFILQEKWYEIFEKEKYGQKLGFIRKTLDSILKKNGIEGKNGRIIPFHLNPSDMSKEEIQVWYDTIFVGCWDFEQKEMTFDSFVKNCPISDYLSDIVENAFNEYVEYIRQAIWKQVLDEKNE